MPCLPTVDKGMGILKGFLMGKNWNKIKERINT